MGIWSSRPFRWRFRYVTVPQIIVLEKRPRWCPELQRQTQEDSIIVKACRDIPSLRELVAAVREGTQPCAAVIDPTGWPGDCLPLIAWLSQQNVPTLVVGFEGMELLEPSIRELGATSVMLPPIAGHGIARECRRLLGVSAVSE